MKFWPRVTLGKGLALGALTSFVAIATSSAVICAGLIAGGNQHRAGERGG